MDHTAFTLQTHHTCLFNSSTSSSSSSKNSVNVGCVTETESSNASVESKAQQVQRIWPVSDILRCFGCLGHRPDHTGLCLTLLLFLHCNLQTINTTVSILSDNLLLSVQKCYLVYDLISLLSDTISIEFSFSRRCVLQW